MTLAYIWLSDLLLIALILFLFRLRGVELVAASAYVLCSVIHTITVLFLPVPDLFYYAPASITDFIALIALCCIRPVCDLVYGLARVCVISIGLNIIGMTAYWFYWPSWPYDLAFIAIYVYALVVVGRGGANGLGGRPVRWYFARPAFPVYPSRSRAGKA